MTLQDDERKATEAGELVVQSDEARRAFADLLARAGHKDERIVITLYGREHAAMIGMKDLQRLRELAPAA